MDEAELRHVSMAVVVPCHAPRGQARVGAQAGRTALLSIGWIFLWAFLDKTFGFGFATPAAKAWINGGSPTTGFLKGTGENALGGFFSGLAGQGWVDWLFMAGLLGLGLALTFGIGTRIAAASGGLLLMLMWAAELPLGNNPFMDDHVIYTIVLAGLAMAGAGNTLGLGKYVRQPYLK